MQALLRRRWDILAVTLLVVLWSVFFWRLLTPRVVDQVSFDKGDFSGHYLPFSAYLHNRLVAGEIPMWNPYNNGGLPFVGDTQSSIYYFPKWLTTLAIQLGGGGGYTYHALELEAILHLLFYTLAFYAFLRRMTLAHEASVLASFLGAIAAGYGGYMSGYPPLQVQVLASGVWMPLVLLGILEATRTPRMTWLGLVLGGFALGNAWLAGHPQTTWLMSYAAVAWLWYRLYQHKASWRDYVLGAIVLGGVTFGTTAVSFLPAYEYSSRATRADMGFDDKSNGFPYYDLIQVLLPHVVSLFSPLYIGIATLALAFVAVKHRPEARFWFWATAFAFFFSFGADSALYQALYNVMPGLSVFRGQERVIYLAHIGISVIAALGVLVAYDRRETLRLSAWVLFALTSVIAAVMGVLWLVQGEAFARPANVAWLVWVVGASFLAWVVGASAQMSRTTWVMGVMVILVFDLFSLFMFAPSNYVARPPTEQLSMTVPDRLRVVADDDNDGQPFRVDGYRGLQEDYGTLYGIMDIRGISSLFLGSANALINRNYVSNSYAWEIFAVKYIFNENAVLNAIGAERIGEGQDYFGQYYLHRVRDPRPYAHLVYRAVTVASDAEAIALGVDRTFDRRDTVILQGETPIALPATAPEGGTARVREFLPERVVIDVQTPANALLSLAHLDYPGWQATLNGAPVPTYRAYGGLIALAIPEGSHEVVLAYNPLSFRIGQAISALSFLGVGAFCLLALWHSRRGAGGGVV